MKIGVRRSAGLRDVVKFSFAEVLETQGVAEKLEMRTKGAVLEAESKDFSRSIERLRLRVKLRPDAEQEKLTGGIQEAFPGASVSLADGSLEVEFPAITDENASQLEAVEELLAGAVRHPLRGMSWEIKGDMFRLQGLSMNDLIEDLVNARASDLHLRAGQKPMMRVDGDLVVMEDKPVLTTRDVEELIGQMATEMQIEDLQQDREASFGFHVPGLAYLRVSPFFRRGSPAVAVRLLSEEIPTFEQLHLPAVVEDISRQHRGLFICTGITGSGKSTTLASMIEYINRTRRCHIITIEDPIEYVFRDKKSIISQREVGKDTNSFFLGIRAALREDPDVIMIGEMRDTETIRAAISAAETGHLVFSTLHTSTAVDTLNRIISFFEPAERDLVRLQLAYTIKGVLCQRLLRNRKEGGRIPVTEVLVGGKPIVEEQILNSEISKLASVIESDPDMMSFDQSVVERYKAGYITREDGLAAASHPERFERLLSGIIASEKSILG